MLLPIILSQRDVLSQNANPLNSWLYSNQASLFGDFGTPGDPITMVMPGTAYTAGFGTYLDNPASTALFGSTFGEFGYTRRSVSEEAAYTGVQREHDSSDFQHSLSNAGFVYSFPVETGRFVVGGGYTQHASYNRTISASTRNFSSSVTDFFKIPGSLYSDIAFTTFANDYGDEFQDWNESIFRIGFDNFGDYPGISQVFTITESGFGGEYSLFASTEFRRNLMVGLSLGWVRGNYHYERECLELDSQDVFAGEFIDTSGDGEPDTDIDRVLLEDQLSTTYGGLRARVGILYRLTPFINVGASFSPSSSFKVKEELSAGITTTMNNRFSLDDDIDVEFTYRFKTPSKTSIGIALDRYNRISLSIAADYVNFRNMEVDFEDAELFGRQVRENEVEESELRNVWNLRAGASFYLNPYVTFRGGYSHLPGRFDTGAGNKRVFSFGGGFILSSRILLDMVFQHERWQEESSVYDFARYDYSSLPESTPDFTLQSENADRLVNRWSIMASVVFLF